MPDWQRVVLSFSVERDQITYGETTELYAHLVPAAQTTNRTVSVYRGVGAERPSLWTTRTVGDDGDLSIPISPRHNTTYYLRWSGDGTWSPVETLHLRIRVAVAIEGRLRRYDAVHLEYRVYRGGDPIFDVTVLPWRSGRPLYVMVERRTSRGWRDWASADLALDRDGTTRIRFIEDRGGAYRIHATVSSNAMNLEGSTGYHHFMIRR
jgi:hypothetical protein